jgi:hypothetical protein
LRKVKNWREKIDEKIMKAVKYLSEPIDVPGDAIERPYTTTQLYEILKWSRFSPLYKKSSGKGLFLQEYVMDVKTLKEIEQEVLPKFSESEHKSIENISKEMKKYVEEDWRFIEEMERLKERYV